MSEKQKHPSVSEILWEIIEFSSVLFRDTAGVAWAQINGECHPVRSTTFRRHIQRKFYHLEGKAPHSQAVQESIDQAEAKAIFESYIIENVNVRAAYIKDKILIDLGDIGKTICEVTPDYFD